MKKTLRFLTLAAMALCLTQAAAFAAAPLSVQLDGEAVAFTDAEPCIVNDRTFLPFRSVFEGMGAEVSYDDGVVTAVRGGKTIVMTIGSAEASVTENGKTSKLTMDVAPYIDPSVDRTYVPVRFAAQALGANVGWDGEARTVVIVDVEKQVSSALEGKQFTYLDKLIAYSKKYNQGVWNSECALNGGITVDLGAVSPEMPLKLSVPMSVSAKGATQDQSKLDVTEKLTVDLTSLLPLLESGGSAALPVEAGERAAMLDALKTDGVSVTIRGDLSAGKLYCKPELPASLAAGAQAAGLSADAWYVMDLTDAYGQTGLDYGAMMSQAREFDFKELLEAVLTAGDVNDAADGYDTLSETLLALVNALSDDGFVKNGDVCTTTFEQAVDGMTFRFSLSLTMKGDAVAAYGMEMGFRGGAGKLGEAEIGVKLAVDEQDKVSGSLTMNLGALVSGSFDISGSYGKGGSAPATEPPAGAKILDMNSLSVPSALQK